MSTSDTPRTDAEAFETDYPNSGECVEADFARELERDLTRLAAANKALVAALDYAEQDMRTAMTLLADGQPTDAFNHLRSSAHHANKKLLAAQTTQDKGTM